MADPSYVPVARSRGLRLAQLRARLDGELRAWLGDAREVVLVDYPNHDNVGDSLIWLGMVDTLRRIDVRVVYAVSYEYTRLDRVAAPGVPVLFSGGGSFGDVWPATHAARLDLIEGLADRRVLVMPQSVHFSAPGADARTVAVLRGHPDLTIMVRDEPGLAWAEGHGLPVRLVPDAAFGLDPARLTGPGTDRDGVVALWRSDKEAAGPAAGASAGADDVLRVDWPVPVDLTRRAFRALLRAHLVLPGGASAPARRLLVAACDAMAAREVSRGLRLLDGRPVLLTDRLHASVLGLFTGRTICRVDNSYGKLAAVLDLWWPEDPEMVTAGSRPEAEAWGVERAAA